MSSLLYRSPPTQIFLGYQARNVDIYLDDGGRRSFLNISFWPKHEVADRPRTF